MDENSRASAARKLPQTAANFFVGTNSRVPRMTLAQSSHIIPMPMSATSAGFPTSKAVLSRLRPTPNTPTTGKPPSPPRRLANEGGKVAKAVQQFSRNAEDEEDIAPIDPIIPPTGTERGQTSTDTLVDQEDNFVPISLTRSATENIASASLESENSKSAELDVESETTKVEPQAKLIGQGARASEQAQDSTRDSPLEQDLEDRRSLAPTDNSIVLSAGSHFTPTARNTRSQSTEAETSNIIQEVRTLSDSAQSQGQDHNQLPHPTELAVQDASLLPAQEGEASPAPVASNNASTSECPTVHADGGWTASPAADIIVDLPPSPATPAPDTNMQPGSSAIQQSQPLSPNRIPGGPVHETQAWPSHSESSIASMPLALSTLITPGPISGLQSAFSDSTDPTVTSSPLDRLPNSAAVQTSHSLSKMIEQGAHNFESTDFPAVSQSFGNNPVTPADETEAKRLEEKPSSSSHNSSIDEVRAEITDPALSESLVREALGQSKQNETASTTGLDAAASPGLDGAEILDTAALVDRLEEDAESDASWEDGLLEGVYADSETSGRQDVFEPPVEVTLETVEPPFVPDDLEVGQRFHVEMPAEVPYAESTGDEEILAELIDTVEDADPGVDIVKPRDSLIERTTTWIKHTMEQRGDSSLEATLFNSHVGHEVTAPAVSHIVSDEVLTAQASKSHDVDAEVILLPSRLQEYANGTQPSAAHQVSASSGVARHLDMIEQISPPRPSDERPVLGQKLTRSFSQRKQAEGASAKPIKIPGRLKIPQRDTEVVIAKARRESLERLPARIKSQQPIAEDQPQRKADPMRASEFDDVLHAWSHQGDKAPALEPATPPARGLVEKMVKNWDDSEEEEVASVGVAQRMTLRRMSGYTVQGSPRREPGALPGKLRLKEVVTEVEGGEMRPTKRMLLKHLSQTSRQRKKEGTLPGKLPGRTREEAEPEERKLERVPLKNVSNFNVRTPPTRQSQPLPSVLSPFEWEQTSPQKHRNSPGKLLQHPAQAESEDEEHKPLLGKLLQRDVMQTSPQGPRQSPNMLVRRTLAAEPDLGGKPRTKPGRLVQRQTRPSSPGKPKPSTAGKLSRHFEESKSESDGEQRAKPVKLSPSVVNQTTSRSSQLVPGKLSRPDVESDPDSEVELKPTPGKLSRPALASEPTSKQDARPLPGKLPHPTLRPKEESREEEKATPGKLSPWVVDGADPDKERPSPGKLQSHATEEASYENEGMLPGRLARHPVEAKVTNRVESKASPGRLPQYSVQEVSSAEQRVLPGKLQPSLAGSAATEVSPSLPGKLVQQSPVSTPFNAAPRSQPGKLPEYRPHEGAQPNEQRPPPSKLPEYAPEQASSVELKARPSPGKLAPHAFDSLPTDEPQPTLRPLRKILPASADAAEPDLVKARIVRRKRAPTMAAFTNERPRGLQSNIASYSTPPALPELLRHADTAEPREVLQPPQTSTVSSPERYEAPRSLSTATPRSESRMLRPLRLASSSSAFSTPRRPDVSVTDTSPRTLASELWTPNTSHPAHSAVTEETSVSRSMQSRSDSAQRRLVTRDGSLRSDRSSGARQYDHVSGRGRSHTMQRSTPAGGFGSRQYIPTPDVQVYSRQPPSHGSNATYRGFRTSSGRQNHHPGPGDERLSSQRQPRSPRIRPQAAPTGTGFDISFSLTHPTLTPHVSDAGTMFEFGLRVDITPHHSSQYHTRVETHPEQYEFSNLPSEEMSRVQEEAQEFLLQNLVSPAHSERRGLLLRRGTGETSYRGLSSPFLGTDVDRYGEMGGRSRGTSEAHSFRSDVTDRVGMSPMQRRARQSSSAAGLASPLPYIKRAPPRGVNTPGECVGTHQ